MTYTQQIATVDLSKATRRAMQKYGPEACLKAYWLNNVQGEGPCMIGGYSGRGVVAKAGAMIDAGREMVTGSRI